MNRNKLSSILLSVTAASAIMATPMAYALKDKGEQPQTVEYTSTEQETYNGPTTYSADLVPSIVVSSAADDGISENSANLHIYLSVPDEETLTADVFNEEDTKFWIKEDELEGADWVYVDSDHLTYDEAEGEFEIFGDILDYRTTYDIKTQLSGTSIVYDEYEFENSYITAGKEVEFLDDRPLGLFEWNSPIDGCYSRIQFFVHAGGEYEDLILDESPSHNYHNNTNLPSEQNLAIRIRSQIPNGGLIADELNVTLDPDNASIDYGVNSHDEKEEGVARITYDIPSELYEPEFKDERFYVEADIGGVNTEEGVEIGERWYLKAPVVTGSQESIKHNKRKNTITFDINVDDVNIDRDEFRIVVKDSNGYQAKLSIDDSPHNFYGPVKNQDELILNANGNYTITAKFSKETMIGKWGEEISRGSEIRINYYAFASYPHTIMSTDNDLFNFPVALLILMILLVIGGIVGLASITGIILLVTKSGKPKKT